jgi:hypothetical protein
MFLPAVLWADDFATFRIPTHNVHALSAEVYGTWENHFNSSDNRYYSYRNTEKRTFLDGRYSTNGFWMKDSEPFRLSTQLYFGGEGAKENTTRESFSSSDYQNSKTKSKRLQEQWGASVDGIYYPLTQPLGIRGSLSASGYYSQIWANEIFDNPTGSATIRRDNDRAEWDYSYSVNGEASIGWGRLRDVSSVYDVFLFDQRLQECGALTRPLTAESKQKLINLVYIRSDYKGVHDRPNRFFWKEIQSILEQDGGLKAGGLDAYALYRIAEPYFQQLNSNGYYGSYGSTMSNFYRERGYFVGPVVLETHRHGIERLTVNTTTTYRDDSTRIEKNRTYTHRDDSYDLFMIGLKAEGSLPVGMRLQLHGEAAAYLPQNDVDKAMDVRSSATATYLIADRWLASCQWTQNRSIEKVQSGNSARYYANSWSVSASAGINYYLEDNLSMSLSWQHSQSHRANTQVDSQIGYEQSGYSRNNSVFLGFSYTILGKLTAPGIASSSKLPLRQN